MLEQLSYLNCSYFITAECGDFEPDEHGENLEYLSEFKFSPRQVNKRMYIID